MITVLTVVFCSLANPTACDTRVLQMDSPFVCMMQGQASIADFERKHPGWVHRGTWRCGQSRPEAVL